MGYPVVRSGASQTMGRSSQAVEESAVEAVRGEGLCGSLSPKRTHVCIKDQGHAGPCGWGWRPTKETP
jgi:hypothetical protein